MKTKYAVSLIILGVLVITNPGVEAFKIYLGKTTIHGMKRKFNFFLFSIYNYDNTDYFAFCGNFVELERKNEIDPFKEFGGELIKPSSRLNDTTFLDSSQIHSQSFDTLPAPPPKNK